MLRAESTPAEKKRPSSLARCQLSEARGRALSAFEAGAKQKMLRSSSFPQTPRKHGAIILKCR